MHVADNPSFSELVEKSRTELKQIDEALIQLKELEIEVRELIARIRWQRYLGYDATSIEFVKNLALRDIGSRVATR